MLRSTIARSHSWLLGAAVVPEVGEAISLAVMLRSARTVGTGLARSGRQAARMATADTMHRSGMVTVEVGSCPEEIQKSRCMVRGRGEAFRTVVGACTRRMKTAQRIWSDLALVGAGGTVRREGVGAEATRGAVGERAAAAEGRLCA